MSASSEFEDFLDAEITVSKISKTMIKILDIFAYEMRFLRWDQGKSMARLVHGDLQRPKSATDRMRTVSIETDPDVSSSATSLSRQPDDRSFTSASRADISITESFRACPCAAHCVSCLAVQYRNL